MERYKKALESARRQRQTAASTEHSAALSTTATPPPQSGIVYTQTRMIQVAPEIVRKNRVIAGIADDDPATSTAYKMLRTQVLQQLRQNGWHTLAITSPVADEGKTLTAVNLAISLAMEVTHTVLLVDSELRRPSIHKCFGFTPERGLTDYLLEETPLPEILVHPGIERLVLLPGGKPVNNPSEMLSSPRMGKLVDELKSRYPKRIVLFDLPPMLLADDALAFSPYVDAFLVVVEDGKTQREEITRTLDMLQGSNVLGTILNKAGDIGQAYYY
ncbi:MAG: CpsD/CapB family tyrosine-protein kinase [Gammaproteobacteria bacterium]|nr:CpsD/CapB family tyrosine-protein kinase [Gammaproteobacteria bacterium]